MKQIFREYDMNCLDSVTNGGDFVGITNLELEGVCDLSSLLRALKKSRGEFAGYCKHGSGVALFRDRLGARNLYYCLQNGKLLFSTDLGKLAEKVHSLPDYDFILKDYLQFQLPFSRNTFFKDIKKVMPSEVVIVTRDDPKRYEYYWQPKFGNESFSAEKLRSLIEDSVSFRLSLLGEKKFTAYLSGGLDSSAMTLLTRPKKVFTGVYAEEEYSEMDYIKSVMKKAQFPLEHGIVSITEEAFKNELKELISVLPDPSCGLGVVAQILVAKEAAKQGYDYAFTGEGGDEVFLGYNWNYTVFTLANAARELLKDRYMVRYEPMIEKILKDGFATFTGGLLARGDDLVFATEKVLGLWNKEEVLENNILNINLSFGLPAILTVDEQVGRLSGVEPVSPLVDHNIVDYVCSVRSSERASIPKYMFREAMRGILPEKVRTRYNKMGFPVPYDQWDWSSILPEAMKNLMNRDIIAREQIQKAQTMDRKTWALFSLEQWLRRYA